MKTATIDRISVGNRLLKNCLQIKRLSTSHAMSLLTPRIRHRQRLAQRVHTSTEVHPAPKELVSFEVIKMTVEGFQGVVFVLAVVSET